MNNGTSKKAGGPKNSIASIFAHPEMGVLIPLVLLLGIFGSLNNAFFAFDNLVDIFRSSSYTFIIAAPLTLLMISGGMDLSIAAVTALGCVVCAWGLTSLNIGIIPSILLACLAGGLVGLIKSALVVSFNLPAFIITLGLMRIVNSFLLVTTDGIAVSGITDEAFKTLGQGKVLDSVHWTIIIAILIGVCMQIVLSRTKFGRAVAACGGNRETARLAGINVNKTRYIVEILVSVFAAFCGVCMCSRFNSGQPSAGSGTELTIMASVIIGGTSMMGGSGTILGSFLGCLLLAVINNGLVLVHVSTNWQNMIFGIILIISLFIDKYRRAKSGGGL